MGNRVAEDCLIFYHHRMVTEKRCGAGFIDFAGSNAHRETVKQSIVCGQCIAVAASICCSKLSFTGSSKKLFCVSMSCSLAPVCKFYRSSASFGMITPSELPILRKVDIHGCSPSYTRDITWSTCVVTTSYSQPLRRK